MIKKVLVALTALTSVALAEGINIDIYTGMQNGNARVRDKEIKSSMDGWANSFKVEVSKMVYPHMHFLLGTGYETNFNTRGQFGEGSYDIIPLYLGGRFEYNEEAKWNPYMAGRIGYPIFTNVEGINLDDERYNGWAQIGIGVLYNNKVFAEVSYKQHVTNYVDERKDYDGRFISFDIGYRIK